MKTDNFFNDSKHYEDYIDDAIKSTEEWLKKYNFSFKSEIARIKSLDIHIGMAFLSDNKEVVFDPVVFNYFLSELNFYDRKLFECVWNAMKFMAEGCPWEESIIMQER